jgi:hypothetical protein
MKSARIKLLILSSIITLMCCTLVNAGEIIKPFGDINWDDNVIEVIKKINSRNGTDKTTISINMDYIGSSGDVTHINNTQNIIENISKVITKFYDIIPAFSDKPAQIFGRTDFYRYYDYETKDTKLTLAYADGEGGQFEIKSSPILIEDIPFTLVVHFRASMGYMEKFKNKLVSVPGPEGEYYLPYYISDVILRSNEESPNILPVKKAKLESIIFNKYKGMLSNECRKGGKKDGTIICRNRFNDIDNLTRLTINDVNNSDFNLIYENRFIENELLKISNTHADRVHKDKYKDKKDAAGDL